MSACVAIANLALSRLDKWFYESNASQILLYGRYIDDILSIDCMDTDHFYSSIERWDKRITFAETGYGDGPVTHLDLDLFIEDQAWSWRLHRKKEAKHLYLHWSSQHPIHVFRGILIGEITRIHRRNKFAAQARIDIHDFFEKLEARGWPRNWIRREARRFASHSRAPRRNREFGVRLRLPFHNSLRKEAAARILSKYRRMIRVPASLGFKLAPNNFVKRYACTWHHFHPAGRDEEGCFLKNTA